MLADICRTIPGLELISKLFPYHHEHEFKDLMRKKTIRHIEKTKDLSEMPTNNMVQILEELQTRYLELLSEKLSGRDKEEFTSALFDMRSSEVSGERLQEAEQVVMSVVDRLGKLIVIGDQLTVILL